MCFKLLMQAFFILTKKDLAFPSYGKYNYFNNKLGLS